MRRLLLLVFATFGVAAAGGFAAAASADTPSRALCDYGAVNCAEVDAGLAAEETYVGHDEPSVLFYSSTPGSGNSNLYRLTLPTDPPTLPTQDGAGGSWNFQLHPAFWLGMALCDNQSAPEFTHAACTPDSDTNIKDGADPSKPDYIGYHAGTAFMELQFYPPGWAPWPAGNSCDAVQWCTALAIFGLNLDQNRGIQNNQDCLQKVGLEPASFAFITTSGVPHAPPDPLGIVARPFAAFTPNPTTDLFMNSGDTLTVDIHDTDAGFQVVIHDVTTGQSGSITASVANGWAQINFDPLGKCTESPYAYHPMYATSSEHTRVPWAAHSYNVAFSDEIGHFEFCNFVPVNGGRCLQPGVNDPAGLDGDDQFCFAPSFSTLVQIGGCIGTDNDFDGVSYQPVWPGTAAKAREDARLHPSSVLFTSPLFNGFENYDRLAFEADLPRIEAADFGGNCNRTTGVGCVNPPPGANFYPIYSTGTSSGSCAWQLGGTGIKGTTNTFGGTSTAEFGPLLLSLYPGVGFVPRYRYNNFRNVLASNACPA